MPSRSEIRSAPTAQHVSRIAHLIKAQDADWETGQALCVDINVRWTPDLIKGDDAVLTVHLASRIRPYLQRRLQLAYGLGRVIHVAMPFAALYDEDLLRELTAIDAQIHLVENMSAVRRPAPVLAQVADHRIRLENEARRSIGNLAWDLSRQDGLPSHVKGRRFESLVCFLLSQVDGFLIVERNFRTETEELDAVIQQTQLSRRRCWSQLAAPFILVEAKNWSKSVTQKEVSAFRVKMQGKRDSVRLGLLFAANGYTRAAVAQELRFASDDRTIVLVGPQTISNWINSDDPDGYLETVVRRAMLR